MIGAKHRPKITDPFGTPCDAVLVKVLSEKVDTVRAGQVVEDVSVEVGERHAGRRRQERSGCKMLTHEAAELEGHAVCADELEIGDTARYLGCKRFRAGEALIIESRQFPKTV